MSSSNVSPHVSGFRSRIHSGRLPAAAILFLLLTLPLPRHWLLAQRPPDNLYFEFTSYIIYLSDLAAIFLVIVALVSAVRAGRRSFTWGPLVITLPLILLVARAAISAIWAEDGPLAFYFAGRLFLLLAVYLSILQLRPSPTLIQAGMIASLLLQSLIALAQFALQHDLGLQALFGEIDLIAAPSRASIINVAGRLWLRAYGLTPHPNILGGLLITLLLPLLAPYLQRQELKGTQGNSEELQKETSVFSSVREKITLSGRLPWLMVLAIGSAALILSFSRSAWLGGAAGGTLFLVGLLAKSDWRKQYGAAVWRPLLLGALLLTPFLVIRRDLFLARLTPSSSANEARSLDERAVLNQAARDLIAQAPWRGVGAANFSLAVNPRFQFETNLRSQPAHNLPLLLTAELGIAGGLLWLWLMVAPLLLAWQRYRTGRLTLWALALTAALLALAITDLFDFYSWGWPQGRLLRWTWLAFFSAAVMRDT